VRPAHPFRGRGILGRASRQAGVDRLPLDPDLDTGSGPAAAAGSHRRSPLPVRRSHPAVLAAVAVGGAVGALARYEVELAWPVGSGHFPVATFVINTSGAFLLGLILTVSMERERKWTPAWRYLRLFACVGVLGAWTTMSTVAVESDTLIRGGDGALALGYLVATMAAGIGAAGAGMAAGRLHRRVGPAPDGEVGA
jgi:fluoride exporter